MRLLMRPCIVLQLLKRRVCILFPKQDAKCHHRADFRPRGSTINLFSGHFRPAIRRETHAVVPRQVATGIPHVPYGRVDEHQSCFENVKVPLVAQYGTQPPEGFHVRKVHRGITGVFDQAIYASYEDQDHTGIECDERRLDRTAFYLRVGAASVKNSRENNKYEDDDDLNAKRRDG